MHPFALPILLLALGLGSTRSAAAAAPKPKPAPPPPAPKPKPKPAQPIRTDPYAPPKPKPQPKAAAPSPPLTEEQASQRAAVNAVVSQVVKEMTASPAKAQAQEPPRVVIDVPRRSGKDAAEYLAEFLGRTHRYGSKKKPVQEVKDAQRDMGSLAIDGIVGPKTRARAAQLGVKLP